MISNVHFCVLFFAPCVLSGAFLALPVSPPHDPTIASLKKHTHTHTHTRFSNNALRSGCAFISGQPLGHGGGGGGTRGYADAASRHRLGFSVGGGGARLADSGVASSSGATIVEARFWGVSGPRRARGGCYGGGVSRRRRGAAAGALRMAADFYEVGEKKFMLCCRPSLPHQQVPNAYSILGYAGGDGCVVFGWRVVRGFYRVHADLSWFCE